MKHSKAGSGHDRDRTSKTRPDFSAPVTGRDDAAYNEGIEAYRSGNDDLALRNFTKIIATRHDDAEAHNWLGLVYLRQGELEDAGDCFVLATHFRSDFADAWYNQALVAQRRDDHWWAVRCLERAIELRAEYSEAYNALGASLLALNETSRAVECFERTIKLTPNHAGAHSNLGYVLIREFGEFERGAAHIQIALDLKTDDPNIWCNQTMVLSHQGRLEEVISVCDQLLDARPDLDEARLNRALARLRLGLFAQAWPDYEARKRVRCNYIERPYGFPEWRGESLTGKTLLVYAEQGIGDEIMFASCLPDLMTLSNRCVLECAPRLEPLFQRSFPGVFVHGSSQSEVDTSWLASAGRIDFQVAAGSLPGHFRQQWSAFPRHGGYLLPDPARVAHWRERTQALGAGPRIGIAWRGGLASTRRELRSTRLEQWLPLMQNTNCQFVSLQIGGGDEVSRFARTHAAPIHHWQEAIDSLDEMAALISALDLVLSVQTATVHLAGALGRPVLVLVPAVPEWRYLQAGSSLPWYPSARLLRQAVVGVWEPVLEAACAEIRTLGAGP